MAAGRVISAAWVAVLFGQAVGGGGRRGPSGSPLDVVSADGSTSLRSALANIRSAVAPDGIPGMLRDAEFVYAAEKQAGTRWVLSACRALGVANVLLGRRQDAIDAFSEALALTSERPELAHVRVFCLGYLAFAATETGDRRSAERWVAEAMALVEGAHLEATAQSTVATRRQRSCDSSAVTTWRPRATSSGSGGSVRCSMASRG